jgi:hypothetical protein
VDGAARTGLRSGLTSRRLDDRLFRWAPAPLWGATVERLGAALTA